MCFNMPQKHFSNYNNDAETMSWQNIFQSYLLKVEDETRTALKMMNDDIERKGLKFNGQLKNSLLRLTNTR